MKRFLTVSIVVGVCVGLFYLMGVVTPRVSSNAARVDFEKKPDAVYDALVDVVNWGRWHPRFKRAEERPEVKGQPVFLLYDAEGKPVEVTMTSHTEPSLLVLSYEEQEVRYTLRFETRWRGEGAMLLMTEQSDARSPWVRARHLFQSNQDVVNDTLVALGSLLGEKVTPKDR